MTPLVYMFTYCNSLTTVCLNTVNHRRSPHISSSWK